MLALSLPLKAVNLSKIQLDLGLVRKGCVLHFCYYLDVQSFSHKSFFYFFSQMLSFLY